MRGSSRQDYLVRKGTTAAPRAIAANDGTWYDNGDGTFTDSITGITIDGSDYGLPEQDDYTQYILWGAVALVLILVLRKK